MLRIRDVLALPQGSILPALELQRSELRDRLTAALHRRQSAMLEDAADDVIATLDAETDQIHRDLERLEVAERAHRDPALLGAF